MKTLFLARRQGCDLECLLNGAFAPLTGFCTKVEYESILSSRRLPSGDAWPMPMNLDISSDVAGEYSEGEAIAHCNPPPHPAKYPF